MRPALISIALVAGLVRESPAAPLLVPAALTQSDKPNTDTW